MPELPEVENVRKSLEPRLVGRRIVRAELRRRDVLTVHGRAGARRALLEGDVIAAIERRGKQLAIVGESGRTLVVHLGMTGRLLATHEQGEHEHARWSLDDGGRFVFRDPRRFGGLWSYESFDAVRRERWAELGPDALEADERLKDRLGGTRRPIKAALLDQAVLAGVGNIYADEALFACGIRPTRRGGTLTAAEASALAQAIREVLHKAIDAGGSSIRDYVNGDGMRGNAQLKLLVYGRGGEGCARCGGRLRQTTVAQRTTVYCPNCQR